MCFAAHGRKKKSLRKYNNKMKIPFNIVKNRISFVFWWKKGCLNVTTKKVKWLKTQFF